MLQTSQLRAAFAARLSDMYGVEVPAYTTLLDVAGEINQEVLRRDADATRLGDISRVTAERHGAIRVGSPREMRQAGQIFAALGMHPVGFYDLRDAAASSVPVVSTAFRPIAADELARNPFRVFTSMLTTADRRFFDADLQARLEAFLERRELFSPELLELAARAERYGQLDDPTAERFLHLAVEAFQLSPEPIDQAWYAELERISAVAADIGGVRSTHVNHLTPRVLDIDELYRRMSERGIIMIDQIQGPPRWAGPDVLLRQTSFRALAEPRKFRAADGSDTDGTLRVRFGEVEAHGIALTREGRALYDRMVAETDRLVAESGRSRQDVAEGVWRAHLPADERGLADQGLAYFTYQAVLDDGTISATPIVYEDFLPRSAAGIFQSNLTDEGTRDSTQAATAYDEGRLSEMIGRQVLDPFELYEAQQQQSLQHARKELGQPPV
jgi:uncharacterized glyoxalase superfamily metalloenzyme YdcJ